MRFAFEQRAGQLLTCADRIVRGHLNMRIARQFCTLNSSHIYDLLEEADKLLVEQARQILEAKYGKVISSAA